MSRTTLSRSLFALGALCVAVGATWALSSGAAYAQEGRLVRMVIPFPPGGGTDVLARAIAPKLAKELGSNVVVENRTGASGQIAVNHVKTSAPDGHTVLLTSDHAMVAVPVLNPTAGYDPRSDFTALGQVSRFQLALAIAPGTKAKNMAEFASYIRANPSKANYGLPVVGGFPSTIGVTVAKKIGGTPPMAAVPFAGSAQLLQNILGDQVAGGITDMPSFIPMHRADRLRIVAVSGTRRALALPDVPTFEELGYTGLGANAWYSFFGPKDMPRAVAERFNRALIAALNDPEVKQRISELGHEFAPLGLQESDVELKAAANFWVEAGKSPDFVRP